MATDSDDCSFTLTSDDENRALPNTNSAKKSQENISTDNVLCEKDQNIPQPENMAITDQTTHNDDDFLAELAKENQQLEAELEAAKNKMSQGENSKKCTKSKLENSNENIEEKNIIEPCPDLPPLQIMEEPSINSGRNILSPIHKISETVPVTARDPLVGLNKNEQEPLDKKCRSLQLRLTGCQKAIKNMEQSNQEKDKIIAELNEKLKNVQSNSDIQIKYSKIESDYEKMKEINEKLVHEKNEIMQKYTEKEQSLHKENEEYFFYIFICKKRLIKQVKKSQGKADYFEKELKLSTEKYKKLQEKTRKILEDSQQISKSYEKIINIVNSKLNI